MPELVRADDPTSDWTDVRLPTLAGGVNSSVPAHMLEPDESPDSENLTYLDGRARTDTGYTPKGEYVSQAVAVVSVAGADNVSVATGYGVKFVAGARIIIPLDTGVSLVTTISSIDTTTSEIYDILYIADNIPAGTDTTGAVLTQSNDLWGVAQGGFDHQTAAGAVTPLLVTTKSVYRYVALPTDEWQYVEGTVETTTNANEAAGSTAINVVSEAGFSATDRIGITMDDGAQHQTTVASTAAGVINIDDALPGHTGTVVTSGNAVLKAIELNGTSAKQVVWAPVPWHEWSVFTNGLDIPMRYDGTSCEVIPNLPNSGNTLCETLSVFSEAFLILGGVTEAGTLVPYKVIWCAAGDATDWTSPTSGSKELLDTRDGIVAMKALSTVMVIYRTRTPVIMRFLGQPYATFSFAPLALGESLKSEGFGPVSANAVAGTSNQHIIFDRRGVFIYQGGDEIQDISSKIFAKVFGSSGLLNMTNIGRSFVHFVAGTSTVWLFYPDSSAGYPNRAAVLDIRTGKWWHRLFNHEISFASASSGSTSTRIIDLVGTIVEQQWKIGTGSAVVGAQSVLLGITGMDPTATPVEADDPDSTDSVAQYDGIAAKEFRQVIDWSFDSVERIAQHQFRLDHVRVRYKGPAAELFILRDSGDPESIMDLSASATFIDYEVFPQTVQRLLQFRISGSGTGAELAELSFKFREEARWGH